MEAKYVVFDGMDGSGKGVQIDLLKKEMGDRVVFTREPGGPPLAEEIRRIVRDDARTAGSTALFQFLLFWAAREESLHKLVMPTLKSGTHVFSDRGDSSTFAFQIFGEENHELLDLFLRLRQKFVFAADKERREPDLYIVFDLPAEVARERVMQAGRGELNHFDVRDLAYYERVRDGFLKFAGHPYYPVRFVDATRTPEEVHRDVMKILVAELSPDFVLL